MKFLLLLFVFSAPDPSKIAQVNRLKAAAEKAYLAKNYDLAAQKYGFLADSLGVEDAKVKLNLAHSYFQLGDTTNAKNNYQSATTSDDSALKSVAYQQLGVMAKNVGNLDESLQYLKSSIKSDLKNESARYDYEVVKKLINQQKENQQNQDKNDDKQKDDQNKQDQKQDQKDQENQDQKDQEKSDQEKQDEKDAEKKDGAEQKSEEEKKQENAEKSDKELEDENVRQKLQEMNISEDKAKMILEALKNNEIQYIQQRKRKATEQPESGKPDW